MHTYEERMRAVELYIKLGKRVQATIRELGYPTKNTLIGWYREYELRQDLPIRSAPRPPKFSEAQKQVALEHYASHGRCISWTMRALGYHRARITLEDKYLPVRRVMADIFESNHRCYGYRRLAASLMRYSITISEKVVRRLMKQEALVVPKPRRRRYSSYLGEISPAPENIINRDFQASAPNEKWLTDITEFHIRAGKVYLSPIIDCFDGMVISWAIGTKPDAGLANTMLDAALETIADSEERPIIHSDRGGHYRWPGWLARVNAAGVVRSMSRKASSQDNAACEGFFGRLKTEFFYPRDWQAFTVVQFIDAVDAYIRWYNETRIKMSLGGCSPIEYRKSLGLMP